MASVGPELELPKTPKALHRQREPGGSYHQDNSPELTSGTTASDFTNNNDMTFTMGTDLGGMAARAREMGLEARAAKLLKDRETQFSQAGFLRGDHLQIQLMMKGKIDDHGHGLISDLNFFETITAIFKSTVGPAILYIPMGFVQSGFLFALPMLMLSYIMIAWSSSNLLSTAKKHNMGYSGLMGEAFGSRGEKLVECMIVLQQCGICLTYFIFVASNLSDIASSFGFDISMRALCFCQLVLYIPLALIRNLQNFAITNLIATALILVSTATLIYFAIDTIDGENRVHETLLMFNQSSFYRFVGTSVFIFEGIMALCVPLQQAVSEEIRDDFPTIFVVTLGIIVVCYMMFGALNYCAYGTSTEMVLTANLPDEGPWRCLVQIAFACAVVFTFPLQLFPAVSTLSSFVAPQALDLKRTGYDAVETTTAPVQEVSSSWIGHVGRAGLVAFLSVVAVLNVDKLDKMVSLLGALFGVPLALILPSAIHLKLCPDSPDWVRRVDGLVIALGVFFATTCSGIVILTW